MARRRKGERVQGPYRHRGGWRVILVAADGSKRRRQFESEAKALRFKAEVEAELASEDHTTDTALQAYTAHLERKGNKPGSIDRTRWAVLVFFPEPLPLWGLTDRKCGALYESLADRYAVDSHRNALAETKTFLDWCVAQRWISENPARGVKGVGRRKKGKPQLRISDTRRWYRKACALADDGDDGAIAALMALVLGMRASEITSVRVRDLDEDEHPCDVLWIPDSKTEAGRRHLDVPEPLRGFIKAQAEAKGRDAWLFPTPKARSGKHDRDWPRAQVSRICRAAGVDEVTAHAMRGTLSTISLERGAAAHIVAATLGHEDPRTTIESYAKPGSAEKGGRARGLKVLEGGRK